MATTDTLRKPDMAAVVGRTHISTDLHGFLLPVFEAISNSIYSVEQKFGSSVSERGLIVVSFKRPDDPKKLLVSISDNGVGLNKENYESFLTPFSGLKLSTKGRGFGRFIAFKVFSRILYSSNYEAECSALSSRTFRFDIYSDREITYNDGIPDFSGTGVRVEFDDLKPEWHSYADELTLDVVADEIAHHFFPEFLKGSLPRIELQFGNQETELTARFQSVFNHHEKGVLSVEIEGREETLNYVLSRIPRSRKFNQNALLLSAGARIVGNPKDLSQKLGRSHFVDDEDNKYIIIAVISGEGLEKRLNDARTSIDFSAKVIEDIVSRVAAEISKLEAKQIDL